MDDKVKFTEKELSDFIHMLAYDMGIEESEFNDSSKLIDTFLFSYLLANVEEIVQLWNNED